MCSIRMNKGFFAEKTRGPFDARTSPIAILMLPNNFRTMWFNFSVDMVCISLGECEQAVRDGALSA